MRPFVSERRARTRILRSLLVASASVAAIAISQNPVWAGGPTGGTVVAGKATISGSATDTLITQKSQKAILNWDDFSISSGSSVTFAQPNANAIALNRVIGPSQSVIDGTLTANGRVWIINGNGVMFGAGSQVNVGSLIATTADIANGDFMSGNYAFSKASKNANAAIVNDGHIRAARGGDIVLAGPVVENNGLIQADLGSVTLAGGRAFTVDFQGDKLIQFAITKQDNKAPKDADGKDKSALVSNSGKIAAADGRIVLTARAARSVADNVINTSGIIEATSVHKQGGTIVLDAGPNGEAQVSGTLAATGLKAGQTGGSVSISGHSVKVASGTTIDASGTSGGGTIAIGGGLHGKGATRQAETVNVGNATIKADAVKKGDGGTISVWSKGDTHFAAHASARGGKSGGDGGLIETSGHNLGVGQAARVDTRARHGAAGTWLLDPYSIDIQDGGESGIGGSAIAPSTIIYNLGLGDVTLQAEGGGINVYSAVDYSSSHTFSLLSQGDIYVAADIQNSGSGAVNIVAGWDGTTTDSSKFGNSGVYGNNYGTVYVTSDYDLDPDEGYASEHDGEPDEVANVAVGSAFGKTTVSGYDVDVFGYYGASQIGYRGAGTGKIAVNAVNDVNLVTSTDSACPHCYAQIGNGGYNLSADDSGNITIKAGNDLSLSGGAETHAYAQIGNGGDVQSGAVSGAVTVDIGGSISLLGGAGDYAYAQIGNGGDTHSGTASGNISVSADGSIALVADGDYAQIGNGGWGEDSATSGTIDVTSGGDLSLTGGGGAPWGYAQIGHGGQNATGDFSGKINVAVGGNLILTGGTLDGAYVQIGNGMVTADPNPGDSGGEGPNSASGNIAVTVAGTTTMASTTSGADIWIGNLDGTGTPTSGSVTLVTGMLDSSADGLGDFTAFLSSDLSGGNVILGVSDGALTIDPPISVDTSHTLSLLASGDVDILDSIQNSGSGAINLVAGWDGTTLSTAHFGDSGVYGNNSGSVLIGGASASGNVAVGSASGATSVYASNFTLTGSNGYAQLGYHGAGGGAINLYATGDAELDGSSASHYAMIGNGALDGSVSGNITGDIFAQLGGTLTFSGPAGAVWVGNMAASGSNATGNVTLVGQDVDDSGSGTSFGEMIVADLGTSNGTGGNVTVGNTSGNLKIRDGVTYSSPHTLSLLSVGDIDLFGSLQNSGTGAINLVAGWNGTTLNSAHFADSGVYARNGTGTVLIGGAAAAGNVAVGTGGTLSVYTEDLTLNGKNGYAQLGYHGSSSGKIAVAAAGTLTMKGGSSSHLAAIGNGSSPGIGGGIVALIAKALSFNANSAVAGQSVTIAVSGADDIGAAAIPLQIWTNKLALTAGGGDAFLSAPGGALSIGVSGTGIDLGGGALTLTSPGAITQTAAIKAGALDITSTGGAITLTNTGNMFDTLSLATSGSNGASVYDGSALGIAGATVGGTFTLTSTGAITQSGAILAGALDVTSTGGAITLQNSGNVFGSLDVTTSGSRSALFYDGGDLSLTGADVGGSLGIVAAGAITQTGAIAATKLIVNSEGGDIALTNASNAFDTLSVTTAGSHDASFADSSAITLDSPYVGGDLTVTSSGAVSQSGSIIANGLAITSGGDVVLDDLHNSFKMLMLDAGDYSATIYDNTSLAVNGATANGGLTLLSTGDLTFNSSVQIASGSLLAVAGWNDIPTDDASLTTGDYFGNANGSILIGGAGASGDVAVGASGGATLAAYDVTLSAVNGFAQFGIHGGGSGALSINAKNDVMLAAGSASGDYAQIGHGGAGTSGSSSGDISVSAGGDVDLTAGSGTDAYAQIGHGGGKANANSSGYSETGTVTVTAVNANFTGGSGTGAYAQLGHGGYLIGDGLTGTATMTGDVTLTVSHTVNLTGGTGNEAFAQIGNGGDQANSNAGSGASGTTSGDITVTAPQGVAGGVNLLAGSGLDAYAQIGNGGYGINGGATPANFTIGGNVSVTDLLLVGGNGSANAYSQIGNGDAGGASSGNVSGNIAIETGGGTITITPGSAQNSGSSIGNATGKGTVSGTVTGYSSPSTVTNNVVAVLTDTTNNATTTHLFTDTSNLLTIDTGSEITTVSLVTGTESGSTPIEDLMGGKGESNSKTDEAANSLGNSLDGSKKKAETEIFIGGLLKRRPILPPSERPHGIPPANGDYSSWGNEAFWE